MRVTMEMHRYVEEICRSKLKLMLKITKKMSKGCLKVLLKFSLHKLWSQHKLKC